jgi:hypothetical protein
VPVPPFSSGWGVAFHYGCRLRWARCSMETSDFFTVPYTVALHLCSFSLPLPSSHTPRRRALHPGAPFLIHPSSFLFFAGFVPTAGCSRV